MTVSTTIRKAGPFAGTGLVSSYPFAFKVFTDDDLLVIRTPTGGADVTLVLASDYTVTLNPDQDTVPGGSVVLSAPLAVGYALSIGSQVDSLQGLSLTNNGGFFPKAIENALDKLDIQDQQQEETLSRALRVPFGSGAVVDLQPPEPGAGLVWNSAGTGITNGTPNVDYSVLRSDLASASPALGSSLVGVEDSGSWFFAVATKTVETVLAWIGSWLWGRDINAFEYLSVAQIASVKAYNFSVDCTVEIQAAMDAAWSQKRDLFLPAGGYKIDAASLVLPGNYPTLDERYKKFRLYGQGYGNPFATTNTAGTVLKSTSDRPILTSVAIGTLPNAHGTFELDHIRFDGTSTTPVVKLFTTYGNDEYHHFSIYQRGTGDGFYIGYSATASVHDCYFVNKDFVTATLGAARTGVGLNFPQGYGAGLLTITKCSSRGWLDAYKIGQDSGTNNIAYSIAITHCEASTVYNGITFGVQSTACAALENYMEGLDGGTGVIDKGEASSIIHNELLGNPAIGIDLQNATRGYGTTCERNEVSLGSRDDVIGIKINNGAGGLGRSICNNFMIWGRSGIVNPATGVLYNNVVGIQVSGANAQVNLGGNMFNPKINWSGLGTTAQIEDLTTSTLSAGSGQYGLGTASFDHLQIPMLNQGAVSFAKSGTNITDVVGGGATGAVLLTAASSHVIAFTGAKGVTSFTAPNIEGKFFVVRVTNGNCTFTNGASLKMAGSVNYTPGANGAMVTFLMHSNVAYEIARTAF